MSPHAPVIRWLVRLVFGVREQVLERPVARSVLRTLGWPAIKLMHAVSGRAPEPPPVTPDSRAEPVLRLPLEYPLARAAAGQRVCVLLHAFHVDVLAEIRRALANIPGAVDLIVSTDSEAKRKDIAALFAGWGPGSLTIDVTANRGRNIAPQLAALRRVADRYDLALLLHTKVSAHTDELAGWRAFLLRNLLGSPALAAGVLETFAQLPNLGVLAPRTFGPVRPHVTWGVNFAACRDLAERLGLAVYPDSALDFPAGAMFWARPAALKPLLDLDLQADDFAPEEGQKDGTLAHAVERLVFHACELAGFRWARAGDDQEAAEPETLVGSDSPRGLSRILTDCGRALVIDGRRPDPTWTPEAPPPPPADERKQALRDACLVELEAFLASGRRLALPASETPRVSIVLALYNQAELTFQCLRSLCFGLAARCEVIIVDNASSDLTGRLLDRIDGARVIRNPENRHFLAAVNQAAELARGEALLLLNNDTRLARGAIDAALATLMSAPDVGAVGGRIELLDGTLQEAGSIIWNDGSCEGYGRGDDPMAARFQFRREVDYCSGAFLMLRRDLFEQLGRLDEAFSPAYYEETDLCMRLRAAGFRTIYEPRAVISHVEFGSASSSEAALELQRKHHQVFTARHAAALQAGHRPPTARRLEARMRERGPGRVLIVEDQIPLPQLGAGYPRSLDLLRAVFGAGWSTTFYPLVYPDVDYQTANAVLPRGVEIAAERGRLGLEGFLKERAGYYDAVVVSRPHNMQAFRAALAKVPGFIPLDRVVYDAEAIFALRDEAGADLRRREKAVRAELALALGTGAVLAVSEAEAEAFRETAARDVRVLGHALQVAPTPSAFAARRGFLFVGALDEDGSPNVDSLQFFVREVMPRLDALIGPDYALQVAGRSGSAQVRALAGDRVRLLGRVESLRALYDQARVFVAPTRFAAGIPMKVHEAAAAGLPVAATPLLATQLGWSPGAQLMTGEDAEAFARACAALYGDERRWNEVRAAALARVAADCDPAFFSAQVAGVLSKVAGR